MGLTKPPILHLPSCFSPGVSLTGVLGHHTSPTRVGICSDVDVAVPPGWQCSYKKRAPRVPVTCSPASAEFLLLPFAIILVTNKMWIYLQPLLISQQFSEYVFSHLTGSNVQLLAWGIWWGGSAKYFFEIKKGPSYSTVRELYIHVTMHRNRFLFN